MSIIAFTAKRVLATAATFLTIKLLTSRPVCNAGSKVYKKLTGRRPTPDPMPVSGRDYDPHTGEVFSSPPFEG